MRSSLPPVAGTAASSFAIRRRCAVSARVPRRCQLKRIPPLSSPTTRHAASSFLLESRVKVNLHGVDVVGRAVDGGGVQPTQTHPYPIRKPIVADQVVALCIRPAEMKIRVRIGIDDRVALQVTISDQRTPGTRSKNRGIAERNFRLIAFGARSNFLPGARENFPLVEAQIPHRVCRHSEVIPSEGNGVSRSDVD